MAAHKGVQRPPEEVTAEEGGLQETYGMGSIEEGGGQIEESILLGGEVGLQEREGGSEAGNDLVEEERRAEGAAREGEGRVGEGECEREGGGGKLSELPGEPELDLEEEAGLEAAGEGVPEGSAVGGGRGGTEEGAESGSVGCGKGVGEAEEVGVEEHSEYVQREAEAIEGGQPKEQLLRLHPLGESSVAGTQCELNEGRLEGLRLQVAESALEEGKGEGEVAEDLAKAGGSEGEDAHSPGLMEGGGLTLLGSHFDVSLSGEQPREKRVALFLLEQSDDGGERENDGVVLPGECEGCCENCGDLGGLFREIGTGEGFKESGDACGEEYREGAFGVEGVVGGEAAEKGGTGVELVEDKPPLLGEPPDLLVLFTGKYM